MGEITKNLTHAGFRFHFSKSVLGNAVSWKFKNVQSDMPV